MQHGNQVGFDTPVRSRATPSYFAVKGLVDRVVGLCALTVAAPVMLLLAVLIRRDSLGPALFRQVRAGRIGRPFTLFKFRTMRTDVDPYGNSPQHGSDPRITRLGRWLRETSLDELPQLINVVRGDMSLVGPRPLYIQQMVEWTPRHRGRLLVPPGLTGLAQINGRGALSTEDKLEWDVRYVESACLRLDVIIIWRTFLSLFTRADIYEVTPWRPEVYRQTYGGAEP